MSNDEHIGDHPVVLRIKRIDSFGAEHILSKPRIGKHTLTALSSKSEDSLDSGVYSRQKSCDSMDSLDSNDFNGDGNSPAYNVGLSPSDELLPPLPTQQYDDYFNEILDIRQSIIVSNSEEEKKPVSRTDSGDDDDHEAHWLRLAGLSDLVVSSNTSPLNDNSGKILSSRMSTDSLSSMTVLSTLTRPQREAVLRRITSFNRAQKSKRKPKPAITTIFPEANVKSAKKEIPPPLPPHKPTKIEDKSSSLPRGMTGFVRGSDYTARRYSESTKSDGNLSPDAAPKLDYISKHRKNVESIVATTGTGGIETLSISHRTSTQNRKSWQGNKEALALQFSDGTAQSKPVEQLSYSQTEDKESLPNFSLVKDRLGITQISDLSPPDVRKVQSLALIELTALFDLRNIELKRRKVGKLKFKDSGVFGVPLSNLLENDQKRTNNLHLRVPLVLLKIVDFLSNNALQDEGILRKSGSAARVKLLKQDMDLRFGGTTLSELPPIEESKAWNEAHPNDLATLLKQFLRELPDPLLSNDYIDAFHSSEQIANRKEQLQALNLLIILLNEVHRNSLKLLLKFLMLVVNNEQSNKMSLNNVAMIIAPNLFMARKQNKNTSQDIKNAAGTSNIVRMLVKYHKLLWTVPAFMLTQVRNMNRAENTTKKNSQKEKHKLKFFPGKKDIRKQNVIQENQQPFHHDTPKGVIKIQAPNMIMTSMAVQLDVELTAGDVIAKFQKQCEKLRLKGKNPEYVELIDNNTHALHEVGGNIGERCLDPSTNMGALLRINPEASWFIRPRVH